MLTQSILSQIVKTNGKQKGGEENTWRELSAMP
jgi:hypothetical protein